MLILKYCKKGNHKSKILDFTDLRKKVHRLHTVVKDEEKKGSLKGN